MNFERVRKAVAAGFAAVAAVSATYTTAVSDGHVSAEEWGSVAGAVVVGVIGTYMVWRVRNEPEPQPEPEVPTFVTGQWEGPHRNFPDAA